MGEPVGASVRSRQLGFFHRHRGCLRQRLDFFLLLVMVSFSSSHTLTYVGFGVVGAPVGSWVGTVGEPVGATVCSRQLGFFHGHRGCLRQRLDFCLVLNPELFSSSYTLAETTGDPVGARGRYRWGTSPGQSLKRLNGFSGTFQFLSTEHTVISIVPLTDLTTGTRVELSNHTLRANTVTDLLTGLLFKCRSTCIGEATS